MKLARRQPALRAILDYILGAISRDRNTGSNDPYTKNHNNNNNNNNNNRNTVMQIKLNDLLNYYTNHCT